VNKDEYIYILSLLLVLLFEVLDYMTTSTIIIIITCHLLRYRVAVKMLASWFIRQTRAAVFCTLTVKMHVEYVSLDRFQKTFAQNWAEILRKNFTVQNTAARFW